MFLYLFTFFRLYFAFRFTVTPFKHFGSGWGECVDNELQIHTTTKGQWNVLITASRNDYCSQHMCPQEIEYIPIEPENDTTDTMPQ